MPDRQGHTPDAPVMVVGKDYRVGRGNLKAIGNEADERRLVEQPVSPDDEASRRTIIENAAPGPFLIFRPDRHDRNAGLSQRPGAAAREFRPVLEMAGVNRQHLAAGLGLLRRNGIVEIEIGLGNPNLPARSFTAAQIRQAITAARAREEAARRGRPARAH